MNDFYYLVIVQVSGLDFSLKEKIRNLAFDNFQSNGSEEFSMEESEVDELLGQRSYSGGDVPESVIDEVNDFQEGHSEKIKFYFSDEMAEENSREFFKVLKKLNIPCDLLSEKAQDWNQEWRKHYEVIKVSDHLKIVPSWEKKANENDPDSIYIYPGFGFGTGSHETTFLCLKALESLRPLTTCLDFGCGSGILGIGAQKKGFKKVDYLDIDPAALENCQQNLDLNQIEKETYQLLLPHEISKLEKKYQLIFANILEPVLIREVNFLFEKLAPQGYLILSGILIEQKPTVKNAYLELGMKLLKEEDKNDWSCLVFTYES